MTKENGFITMTEDEFERYKKAYDKIFSLDVIESEFVDGIYTSICWNSLIEADEDDDVLFNNIESSKNIVVDGNEIVVTLDDNRTQVHICIKAARE